MKTTCIKLPPELVTKVKNLDFSKLNSTDKRLKALGEVMGEARAKTTNNLYENSLLVKNRKNIFDKFVDDINGLSIEKKAKVKEQIAKRLADRQIKIEDDELLGIVQDALNRKYDLDIPEEKVQEIFKLKKEISKLKAEAQGFVDGSEKKLAWGKKEGELADLIADLKNPPEKNILSAIKTGLKESGERIKAKEDIYGKTGQALEEVMSNAFNLPLKGIKAAWDASYILRQGFKVLTADPKLWAKNVKGSTKSWTSIFDEKLMKDIYDGFRADIVTRDLYQEAIDSGLGVGVIEDFFPTNIAEKIPGIGRMFKASDDSFTMFSQGSRMDLFEKYVKAYTETNGAKPDKELMKGMARYVNQLTGRGNLGKLEANSKLLNQIFFSARYQAANLVNFFDPLIAKTPEVRAIARKNFVRNWGTILATAGTLSAVTDVGWNPKETTFGKARIPGTKKWVDITGGQGSYISAALRSLGTRDTKYGEDNGYEVFLNFLSGKLAPVPGAIRDYMAQRDFSGNKPTPVSVLRSMFVPINADNVIKNVQEQEEATTLGLQFLFDTLGAGVGQPKSRREGSYDFIKN